jgi:CRISPR-associated protein Cas1
MSRHYYLTKNGRLRRQDHTLYFETEEQKRPIPVDDVESLFVFGELDLNTKLLNFLAQKHIPLHVFNYYGYYSGSYYPREYLNSGFLLVKQVEHYLRLPKRMLIARELIDGAVENILKNLRYYDHRGAELGLCIADIEREQHFIAGATGPAELMGIEGRIRQRYYQAFTDIIKGDYEFEKRVKRPPDNILNALISFGNSLVYAAVLGQIYRTQLNPTVSFLHEPGARRFSLSLDLAEIFKPLLTDRILFKLLNTRMLNASHFDQDLESCYLKENGRRIFLQEFDEKLNTTIMHRKLGRKVSYEHLIRLECYKLAKHLMGDEPYKSFRMWW